MQHQVPSHSPTPGAAFPTDPSGLPEATRPPLLELADGDVLDLQVGPVAKRLGDATVRMLGYNGSIPGPTLKVRQGSEVVVHVTNRGDLDTTVHWHGLRLENRYDGVPHETQLPIPVGGEFTYRIQFPDPGLYWYHPHVREDYAQELGLYGNILVVPAEPDYWPPADRDVVLTLDDILLEDGKVAPFSPAETTYAAMGRYGNVILVGGETDYRLTARAGEVVRLWLTNTANTRVFNVTLPGARMKLVGGDSGRVEREQLVSEVLLAPSERAVVDVLFEGPETLAMEHRTPHRAYPLASITVDEQRAAPAAAAQFEVLRSAPELAAERRQLGAWLTAPPDRILALVAEMDDPTGPPAGAGPVSYACPMHPEVTSPEPGRCPRCGMKLLAAEVVTQAAGHDPSTMQQAEQGHDHHGEGHDHAHGQGDGIEWEDDMVAVNRLTTSANVRWKLVDRTTGAAGAAIDWRFTVGDRVKIRLVNEMDSDHPMHHPFHLHGAGRFLVLARDGVAERNLVWKDTVLVRTGQTVDILFDVTNPGLWMAHCHIAEHMQSGMMFSFNVARETGSQVSTPVLPLTERILSRLPGNRLAWVVAWALVPWLNLAVVLAIGAGGWARAGVPPGEVLNRTAVSFAVLLSFWGAARITDQLGGLRAALANVVGQEERDVERLFRGADSTLAPLLLTAASAVVLPLDEAVAGEPAAALVQAATWLVIGIPMWTAVWVYLTLQAGLNRLGRGQLTLQAYRGDRSLGLRPVGRLAFTGFWMLLGSVGPLVLAAASDRPGLVVGTGVLVAGVGLFFLSLRRLNRQMVAAKRRELDWARDLYVRAYQAVRDEPTLEVLQRQVGLLSAAEAMERRAERIQEWPFDEATFARVVTISSSVAAVIISDLILDPVWL